jgi:prephenate dehydrogenase
MAVIPVKDPEKECEFAKQLFPETKLIQVSAESHDKMMAYVLSLPYFMNLVFAHSLTPFERDLMETLSGTTFRAQTIVTDCIVGESPELVESLINGNTYSWDVINQFIDEARYLRRVFKRGDDTVDGYCRTLREQVEEEILLNARRLRGKMVDYEDLYHLAELFR